MSPMRLWNILARVSCALNRACCCGGAFGMPPESLKLVAGATHMMATPTSSSTLRSTLGGTIPSVEELVEFVGGDLGLVAFEVAVAHAGLENLPGG